jgi:carbonic anhydrase
MEFLHAMAAEGSLGRLMEGNGRFVANRLHSRRCGELEFRCSLVEGQKPFAIILTCSDSRVPPEIIFDMALGEIFVVRVAGNIAPPVVVGSIEYAADHLGCPLLMVLGHQRCGAVTAAVNGSGGHSEYLDTIMKTIAPAVERARKETKGDDKNELVEAAIDHNMRLVRDSLLEESAVLRSRVRDRLLRIVCAKYDLTTGEVKIYPE